MRAPRALAAAVALLSAAALASTATAAAAPTVAREIPLAATPGPLALGPDGAVWVTLAGGGPDLARIAPDGSVAAIDVAGVTSPAGIAAGPDGALWLTQAGGVARVDPAAPAAATIVGVPGLTEPIGIVTGPDGNLWTASGDRAVRVTPAGVATSYPVPGMGARGIAAGGDGRLYLADAAGGRIVVLGTAGGAAFRPAPGAPQQVAAGPGEQVAFTNPGATPPALGRLSRGGAPATTAVPGTDPHGIALGADGAYWAANPAANTLTRLTPAGETGTLGGLSPGARPRFVAAGADGTLWVALEGARAVAVVTGAGPVAPAVAGPPAADETAPRISHIRAPRRVRRGRAWTMRLTLSEPATLGVNWWSGRDVVAFKKIVAPAGRVVVRLGGRRLHPGPHRVTIAARDPAGNLRTIEALRLRVLPRARRRPAAEDAS